MSLNRTELLQVDQRTELREAAARKIAGSWSPLTGDLYLDRGVELGLPQWEMFSRMPDRYPRSQALEVEAPFLGEISAE